MRFIVALALAVGISLALFLLMHYMIAGGDRQIAKAESYSVVDFVRLKRERDTEVRKRDLPKKPPPPKTPPPPPQLKVAKTDDPDLPQLKMPTPKIAGFKLGGGPFLGGIAGSPGQGDGEVVPLVRIAPQYPRKAAMAGTEGWVKLEFTITEAGTVVDPVVLEAQPPRTFNRAAIRAILRWKFKPKIEDGKPVQRRATQVIEFKLSER